MSAVPVKVTRIVDARDGYRCVRCGASLEVTSGSRHHRQRRAVGGHLVSNLILLCGSGTTGCHGWVHANVEKARMCGWIVPANGRATPEDIPLLVYGPFAMWQEFEWFRLNEHGNRIPIDHATAVETLAVFGITWKEVA